MQPSDHSSLKIETNKNFTGNRDTDEYLFSKIDDRTLFNLCLSSKFIFCNDQNFWKRRFISKFGFVPEVPNWKRLYLKTVKYMDLYNDIKIIINKANEKGDETDTFKYLHYLELKKELDNFHGRTPISLEILKILKILKHEDLISNYDVYNYYNEDHFVNDWRFKPVTFLINGHQVNQLGGDKYRFFEEYKATNVEMKEIAKSILEIYKDLKDTIERIWYNEDTQETGILCMIENGSYAIVYEEKKIKLFVWGETKEISEKLMNRLHNTEILEFCQLNTRMKFKSDPIIRKKN